MTAMHNYLFRQLALPFLYITLALSGVIWLIQSVQLFDLILNRGLSGSAFLYMSMLFFPKILGLILPISLFIAILTTFNRLKSDKELVVMYATGLSKNDILRPVLSLTALVMLVIYALNLYLTPLGLRTFRERKVDVRSDLATVLMREGEFNNIVRGLTIYVRERRNDGELSGILVHDSRDIENPQTIMAERGALVRTDRGAQFVMINGNNQKVNRKSGHLSLLYFDKYTLELDQFAPQEGELSYKPGERYINELFFPEDTEENRRNAGKLRAEGHSRLISPMFAVVFALMAAAAILSGEFSRRPATVRIIVVVTAAMLVRMVGLGLVSQSAKNPIWTIFGYANIAVAILASLAVLGYFPALTRIYDNWQIARAVKNGPDNPDASDISDDLEAPGKKLT